MFRFVAQTTGMMLAAVALSFAPPPGVPLGDQLLGDQLQRAIACPNTGELVIDKIKICHFTCPDNTRTSIRIGADQICPPFH